MIRRRKTDQAREREILRPHGVLPPGCRDCYLLPICGGKDSELALLDCFQLSRLQGLGDDVVSPYNPDYLKSLAEVGGLRFNNLPSVQQRAVPLPRYVPMVHHGYKRTVELNWPVVALSTYELFRAFDGKYRTIVDSPAALRKRYKLDPEAMVILRGTARDRPLERYWANRRLHGAARQLAALGISLVIAPNFSHFLDVPRTDNLFNRKRQLICISEFCEAGLSPVPHLSAATQHDWIFWAEYLKTNNSIFHVAVEFQTGNRKWQEGLRVLDWIVRTQDVIGRPLHPIIIGGAQFVSEAAARFSQFTLMDSRPFMTAVKRCAFRPTRWGANWVSEWTLPGFGIDDLLERNIAQYAGWIETRPKSRVRQQIPV